MYLEIPKFTRCCFFVPLRYGIIALGYLSLAFAIFIVCVDLYFVFGYEVSTYTYGFFRGTFFLTERWLIFVLYAVEIAFIVVLIIGAHLRNHKLMLAYYYYAITTTLAAFASFLFVSIKHVHLTQSSIDLVDVSIMFSGIISQVYLLLLIRSELRKPREALRYVNHLAEVTVQPHTRENGCNPL
ncbi:uncharacterized protein [Choristoneura fumiferana]|uniref:uncharacterized protein n=1 Tax=Choristoneura fumiferana TaxID=7141 RepID=UPI003D158096